MAYTVEAAFDSFYEAINLDGDHRELANTRRDRVVSLLSKKFHVLDSFATGSIPKFTALKNHADLDVMVVLHFGKHIKGKSPKDVLQAVRDALAEYRTGVRKNGQAVTLNYKTWPNVDIVPVSRSVDDDGDVTHYNVPNMNTGDWIKAKPKTHARQIEERAGECGWNFRRIIKMIKWWNLIHGEYLQSYHIEVLALRVLNGDLDDTAWEVHQFFENARPLLESSLWHDLGNVDDYLSYSDRLEVLKRVDSAIMKSRDAWSRTYNGKTDHKGAIEIWRGRDLFGDKFPAYG